MPDVSEPTEYARRLGAAIEAVRDYRGMTQEALGQLVSADGATVGRWERAESAPRAESIARIAKALDIPAEWLLDPPPSKGRAMVLIGAWDELRARPSGTPPDPSLP